MTETGPFGAAALDLAARGLAVIPVGGADGKVPLIAWANWRRPPGKNFLQKLACKHGAANVAILTGLSSLTVIDVDRADLADAMLERFGPTPLIAETPSGGRHHYYRSGGERSTTLRDPCGHPAHTLANATGSSKAHGMTCGTFHRLSLAACRPTGQSRCRAVPAPLRKAPVVTRC
jgi:hypothetical protein